MSLTDHPILFLLVLGAAIAACLAIWDTRHLAGEPDPAHLGVPGSPDVRRSGSPDLLTFGRPGDPSTALRDTAASAPRRVPAGRLLHGA